MTSLGLTAWEEADFLAAHEQARPPSACQVYRLSRALESPAAVAAVAAWPAPTALTAAVREEPGDGPNDEAGEAPGGNTGVLYCRAADAAGLIAGDVVKDAEGRVWIAGQPAVETANVTLATVPLTRVPARWVPAALR